MFNVGDRVASCLTEYGELSSELSCYGEDQVIYGTVKGNVSQTEVAIDWDSTEEELDLDEYDVVEVDLLLDAETAKLQWSALTDEYNSLLQEMDKVAETIEKAAKYAVKHGKELPEMSDLTDSLLSAMDNAGWSTSSLVC